MSIDWTNKLGPKRGTHAEQPRCEGSSTSDLFSVADVTDDMLDEIEFAVAMASGAWDCVEPKEIVAACWNLMWRSDRVRQKLASHLWECSALRHGLFTPPRFPEIVDARLAELSPENVNADRSEP